MSAARVLLRLTPAYEPVEGGWVQATLLEMPGVITTAPTRAEAEDMLLDALREFLLSFAEDVATASDPDEAPGLTLTVSVDGAPAA